ncbi:MAG TPA: hypothetical protein VKE93_08880 [Candidatus Angelobacter sp.]|nr:hypothetical protein [Candidatus Angelobacter sp.]
MGVVAAILSSAFFAVLFAGGVAANPAAVRAELDRANQQMSPVIQRVAALLNVNPEDLRGSQETFSGARGLVLFTAMGVFVTLVFLVIFGSIAGALAAGRTREKGS